MRVALYARVSTARQAENELSIPDQLNQLRAWCQAHGHIAVDEFVEMGASATSDNRPAFQEMIAAGMAKPPAFEAVIVHSLSRFFRDSIEFGLYERKLEKNGVKIISITQPMADDTSGQLVRRIVSMFDEHQSKENAKHTSRAMKENARQGYFNGAKPPYGYVALATEQQASRGRKKKRLQIDVAEAAIVTLIYELYLHGIEGRKLGCKDIAKHLNTKGILTRGRTWSMQAIHKILSDTLYRGEHTFNVKNSRTKQKRPREEWVTASIPAIIDAATFERARAAREARTPAKISPSILKSPNLLTGLLRCGICGCGLTVATGKSGQYKYYKCTNRKNKGNASCSSKNYPMKALDAAVLHTLAQQVLTDTHIQKIIAELRSRAASTKDSQQKRVNALMKQLKQMETRRNNLLNAIELGMIDHDLIQNRGQQIKASIESLHIELAGANRTASLPLDYLKPSKIESVGKLIRQKFTSGDLSLAKGYLNLLVEEIRVEHDTIAAKGSNIALAETLTKLSQGKQVPTIICEWRARQESNLQPLA